MTPQTQAKEIVLKYQKKQASILHIDCENDPAVSTGILTTQSATEYAILEVTAIISVLEGMHLSGDTHTNYNNILNQLYKM